MITNLQNWFAKPYPRVIENKVKLAITSVVAIVCFLILVIFRPFGLHEVTQITYLAGFGICAFVPLAIYYFLLPNIFSNAFDEDHWTIRKEFLSYVCILLAISSLNYFYNSTIGKEISPQYNFFQFVFMTVAVGAFPVLIMIYLTERIAKNRNNEVAIDINSKLDKEDHVEPSSRITIVSNNKTELPYDFKQNEIIAAKSSGNYIELFLDTEKSRQSKYLIRLSMSELESQMIDNDAFLRCHKSYLINKSNVENVHGNARSCVANMHNGMQIPISRTFDRHLISK